MRFSALLIISGFLLAACQQTVFVDNSAADDRNRVVDIVNRTDSPMLQFYALKPTQRSKGQNLIEGSAIGSGSYLTLNFDDSTGRCVFDFRAEFSNGSETRRDAFNVCTETAWTVF